MGNAAARTAAAKAGDSDALNRMRNRRPAQTEIWLGTDDEAVEAYRQTQKDTRTARLGRDDAARETAEKRLHDARLDLEASGAVRFLLRNVGRRRYRELVESEPCRPTDADHEDVRRTTGQPNARAQWGEEFLYRLVALCAVEPEGLTHEELREWLDDGRLSEGEMNRLFNGAVQLHVGDRVVDLGK